MVKDVIIDGRKYRVDTTPVSPNGPFRYSFAEVYGVSESPATGVVANALRQMGREPVTQILTGLSDKEQATIVQTLGYSFSRSKAWRNLWELYGPGKLHGRDR